MLNLFMHNCKILQNKSPLLSIKCGKLPYDIGKEFQGQHNLHFPLFTTHKFSGNSTGILITLSRPPPLWTFATTRFCFETAAINSIWKKIIEKLHKLYSFFRMNDECLSNWVLYRTYVFQNEKNVLPDWDSGPCGYRASALLT